MTHGLRRLRNGFPLSNRLLREMHEILLATGRGAQKTPGEFRQSRNWIGGTRPGNAAFVPPPPQDVQHCMGDLEEFLHSDTPALVKAALAHQAKPSRGRTKTCPATHRPIPRCRTAALDQAPRCAGRHNAGELPTATRRTIAPAPDHPAVRLHFDLQHFAIFGAGKILERLAARRAVRRRQRQDLFVNGQPARRPASVSRGTALLAAPAHRVSTARLLALDDPLPLAFTTKQPLLQISNATAGVPKIAPQGLLTLLGSFTLALQPSAVVLFLLRQALRRAVIERRLLLPQNPPDLQKKNGNLA
jgi:hypothetical protein